MQTVVAAHNQLRDADGNERQNQNHSVLRRAPTELVCEWGDEMRIMPRGIHNLRRDIGNAERQKHRDDERHDAEMETRRRLWVGHRAPARNGPNHTPMLTTIK